MERLRAKGLQFKLLPFLSFYMQGIPTVERAIINKLKDKRGKETGEHNLLVEGLVFFHLLFFVDDIDKS